MMELQPQYKSNLKFSLIPKMENTYTKPVSEEIPKFEKKKNWGLERKKSKV